MRSIKIFALLIFTLFTIMGCASMNKPTPAQITNADYGSYPDNYKNIVENYMARMLFDPYSAVFSNWRGPAQGYIYDITGTYFGYRVCVEVNAKNRMGGYTGNKMHLFVINNGHVINQQGGYQRIRCGHLNIATPSSSPVHRHRSGPIT